MKIFDIKTGKFLEKKKIGVTLLNKRNEWLIRGDLFITEDGRELVSDFGKIITKEENKESFDIAIKQAKLKNQLYEIV